ncbi:hypothetical protein CCUS01_15114 [Colletotrichum cuscutae]|uniref:Uncharacterized protein n=1 Tax=Colletotrichum cuscutae TaxID=1209917 RepID=A0AAI9VG16_9PEZI|nr:hypothetical protein CCUS01_15114 [Colletotrichum cuscutae]
MPNFLCLDLCICQQWASVTRSRKGRSARRIEPREGLDSRRKSGFGPIAVGRRDHEPRDQSSGKGRYGDDGWVTLESADTEL